MKNKAQSVMDIVLIALLVIVVVFVAWNLFGDTAKRLVNLSAVRYIGQGGDNGGGDGGGGDIPETTGALGTLMVDCQAGDQDACSAIIPILIQPPYSLPEPKAKECIANPASCTSLMTVTNFQWKDDNSYAKVSLGRKLNELQGNDVPMPLTFTFTYTYYNNQGRLVTATITQAVFIQKEEIPTDSTQTVGEWLPGYMAQKFPFNSLTGKALDVQNNLNAYMNRPNSELSKTKSDYIDFTDHEDGVFRGCTDTVEGCGITPDY